MNIKLSINVNEKTSLRKFSKAAAAFPELWEKLQENEQRTVKGFDFYAMSIENFCKIIMNDDIAAAFPEINSKRMKVLRFVRIQNTIRNQIRDFQNFLDKTNIPYTAEIRACNMNTIEYTAEEEFYGLDNLEKAQKMTVYEYCIARKCNYNQYVFNKNQEKRLKNARK
jgi:hypothetical protein